MRWLIVFLFFSAVFLFSAETKVRYRCGTVLCAELSYKNPPLKKWINRENDRIWVEITVKPDPKRSLGIYDYALLVEGTEYPCLAVLCENGKNQFDSDVKQIENPDSKLCKMLFLIRKTDTDNPEYELKFKLFSTGLPNVPLVFRHMKWDAFSTFQQIKPEGMLGKSFAELYGTKRADPPKPPEKKKTNPPKKKPAPKKDSKKNPGKK